MSHDLRRISFFAVVFLVLLRLSIGWQFLYEGLWKYQTQTTGNPWTAEGYLLNAQGPFRSTFRNMAGDPDGLNWLDNDYVQASGRIGRRISPTHYQLDDAQKARLEEILNGPKSLRSPLGRPPRRRRRRIAHGVAGAADLPSPGQVLAIKKEYQEKLFTPKEMDLKPDLQRRLLGIS